MSIASYFFTAARADAARNDGLAGAPLEQRAEFYRVTYVNLNPLFAAITGAACPKFELIAHDDDYGRLTFVFPAQYIECLSAFDESRTAQVLAKWRASGEAPYDNDGDLTALLTNLVRLARTAQQANHELFLWNCV